MRGKLLLTIFALSATLANGCREDNSHAGMGDVGGAEDYLLVVEGQIAGRLHAATGGGADGSWASGTTYEPLRLEVGMGMNDDVYNWLTAETAAERRSGSVVACGVAGQNSVEVSWVGARIVSVEFPEWDRTRSDPQYMTVTIQPERTDVVDSSLTDCSPHVQDEVPLRSDRFAFQIEGLSGPAAAIRNFPSLAYTEVDFSGVGAERQVRVVGSLDEMTALVAGLEALDGPRKASLVAYDGGDSATLSASSAMVFRGQASMPQQVASLTPMGDTAEVLLTLRTQGLPEFHVHHGHWSADEYRTQLTAIADATMSDFGGAQAFLEGRVVDMTNTLATISGRSTQEAIAALDTEIGNGFVPTADTMSDNADATAVYSAQVRRLGAAAGVIPVVCALRSVDTEHADALAAILPDFETATATTFTSVLKKGISLGQDVETTLGASGFDSPAVIDVSAAHANLLLGNEIVQRTLAEAEAMGTANARATRSTGLRTFSEITPPDLQAQNYEQAFQLLADELDVWHGAIANPGSPTAADVQKLEQLLNDAIDAHNALSSQILGLHSHSVRTYGTTG